MHLFEDNLSNFDKALRLCRDIREKAISIDTVNDNTFVPAFLLIIAFSMYFYEPMESMKEHSSMDAIQAVIEKHIDINEIK